MSYVFPDPDAFERPGKTFRWSKWDLLVFVLFFALTIIFLPLSAIQIMRMFRPEFGVGDLSGVQQVFLQGVMDLLLIGFIFFLIKIVHKLAFLEAIRWTRQHYFRTGFLVALGSGSAVSVLLASSFFPPSSPPPIEKLITSSGALYVFVLFGVGVAPIVEEIIFRGFLFRVFEDVGGPSVAVPATALLFTLLHVPQLWGSWAGILLILLVGYVLSLARKLSNSLIPSFLIHTAYNGTLFTVYVIGTLAQQTLKR